MKQKDNDDGVFDEFMEAYRRGNQVRCIALGPRLVEAFIVSVRQSSLRHVVTGFSIFFAIWLFNALVDSPPALFLFGILALCIHCALTIADGMTWNTPFFVKYVASFLFLLSSVVLAFYVCIELLA